MALQFAIAIPMAMNVARVISQQGIKAAIKRYGPETAKMVNKNMNALRKKFPDILGPQKKTRMDPSRSKMVKEKYMDSKGKFYSDEAAKKLKDQAATNRRAIGAGAAVVGGGAVLLTGNEDKDSSIVQSAAAKGAPKKPAGLTPSQLKTKMEKRRQDIKESKSDKGSRASLRRFEAKTELARQKELDAVGPGPDMKKRSMPKRKEPSSPTRNIRTRPEPKGPRDQNLRPLTAEKEKPPRVPNTSSRKKSEFGLDTLADRDKMKRFMKDRFNITVTYDDDEDPGDTASRAKGGLFTRRGALYNKPARKK
jgi:hypothetical protein